MNSNVAYPPINQVNGIFPRFPTRRSSLNGHGDAVAFACVILASNLSMICGNESEREEEKGRRWCARAIHPVTGNRICYGNSSNNVDGGNGSSILLFIRAVSG